MENNKMPEAPKKIYNNKSKYIMAIAFGIISVIISSFGFISWSLYLFSIGFAMSSILFAFKYFEIEKNSIVAVIVAVCSTMVVGYSILRTELVQIVDYFTTKETVKQPQYYDPFEYFYEDFFDEFPMENGKEQDPNFWS